MLYNTWIGQGPGFLGRRFKFVKGMGMGVCVCVEVGGVDL